MGEIPSFVTQLHSSFISIFLPNKTYRADPLKTAVGVTVVKLILDGSRRRKRLIYFCAQHSCMKMSRMSLCVINVLV